MIAITGMVMAQQINLMAESYSSDKPGGLEYRSDWMAVIIKKDTLYFGGGDLPSDMYGIKDIQVSGKEIKYSCVDFDNNPLKVWYNKQYGVVRVRKGEADYMLYGVKEVEM
jgi:hypothetical protein